MASNSPRLKDEYPGLLLLLLFLVSRGILYAKGCSFIAKPLSFAIQYLDPVLLKEDLFRSLLYQHSQPPLFNLFLGTILKISPDPALSYEILFKTAGALIPLLLYGVLILIGIRGGTALILTIFYMLNPTLMLYENLLYYTYVEAFCILVSIFFLSRWCREQETASLILFWISLLCLGLMRSLFHPLFFLVIAAALAWYLKRFSAAGKRPRRLFLLCSMIVLVPLLLLCLKNFYFFGFFGTSSWDGMSLWKKVNGYGPDELQTFYDRGLISELALQVDLEPFRALDNFPASKQLKILACHHPADCTERKSTGKTNFNYIGYVALSQQLWKDAVALIKNDPLLFALYTAGSYSLTLWYSSDSVHALFENNMELVKGLEKTYRFLYFGFLGVQNRHSDPLVWLRTGLITVLLVMVYAATLLHLFRNRRAIPQAVAAVCLFCLVLHAYTLLVSSLIEFGENNRFRFPVDAAFLVLAAGNAVIWRQGKGKQSKNRTG